MTTPVPEPSGCPWPVDPACLGAEWDALDPTVQDRATLLASETLRRLTGYRVGGCPVTVRPCKASCADTTVMPGYFGARHGFAPHVAAGGMWVNSCGCTRDCSCADLCTVSLPPPIGQVIEVVVDGTILTVDDYKVSGDQLVWTGTGECPWPVCQDLTLPDTEVGTFSVTYLNAWPVDTLGAYAAGTLAYEYAQACVGNKCRLPNNVTTLTRQGVSMDIATGAFPGGFTGIREVDAFIAIWNPGGMRQPTSVWSPDVRPPRVMR
jgi:hypothetical protein